MTSPEFSLEYDGEILHAEPMSSKTLAPVLAATAQLFEIIHRQYYPFDYHAPQVKVRQAKPGFFVVFFELAIVHSGDVINFPTTEKVKEAATTAGFESGLMTVFLKVMGIFVTGEDNKIEDIPSSAHAKDQRLQTLCDHLTQQKAIHRQEEIVKPVTIEGVDTLAVASPVTQEPVQANRKQAKAIV